MISLPRSPSNAEAVDWSSVSVARIALLVPTVNDLPLGCCCWKAPDDDSAEGFSAMNSDRKSWPEIMSLRRGTGLAIVRWVASRS